MTSRRLFLTAISSFAFAAESGWRAVDPKAPHRWVQCEDVTLDPDDPKKLIAQAPGSGNVLFNSNGKTQNWITTGKFGDLELSLEFKIPKGSNSGIYLHGLYEVQIFDSYGTPPEKLRTRDCGSIYHRWIEEKPVGGSVALENAALPPGEWQRFHILFRAPRFDGTGKKTENARFVRVELNGKRVQNNTEVDGCTRACLEITEAPRNPIMLQGDHGPVAFRNIQWRQIAL